MAKAKQTRAPLRTRHLVDYRAFVKHWTLAQSPKEVAIKMDLPERHVGAVAQKLRKAGVRLKRMRGGDVIDADALNAIIDETEDS